MGKTGGRKPKDPLAPRRPLSSYFLYAASERKKHEMAGQKISRVAEFTKIVSDKWKRLPMAEKKEFDDAAAVDKERYVREMADYKGKSGKDPNKPKRPMSAYFHFLAAHRQQNKDAYPEHKELIKAAGAAWQKMSDEARKPYERLAQQGKAQYNEDMKLYNSGEEVPKRTQGQVAKDDGPPAKRVRDDADTSANGAEDDEQESGSEEEEEEDEGPQATAGGAAKQQEQEEDQDEDEEDDEEEDESPDEH